MIIIIMEKKGFLEDIIRLIEESVMLLGQANNKVANFLAFRYIEFVVEFKIWRQRYI